MNAHQRRKYRRSLPAWTPGCNRIGYSGTAPYPDLMCMDGYMRDADADGYDPSDAALPCPDCLPEEHKQWMEEQHDDVR